ncbi:hypothetical protein JOS77_28765 [Chromobacterium haemolyticum]|nr:hypothetical protein JOS77_28765 [Chromobacterium haemolyticum]
MTELEKQLLEALKLALSSHGQILLTNPPQEAWQHNRVDEICRAAIAAAEAAQATVKDSLIVQQAPAARLSYFAYDPDTGFEQFNTEAEAMAFAQVAIDAYREVAGDGWDEDVENVCWGVVHGTTQQVAVDDDYDGRHGLGEMLFVDYILTGPAPAQVEVKDRSHGD